MTHPSIYRTRQWHEQRTAAGRCHRCSRLVAYDGAWYCRPCRITVSAQRRFVTFVRTVAAQRCVECWRRPTNGMRLRCARCQKGLNAHRKGVGSLPLRASRAAMEAVQPLPLPIEPPDPGGAVAE